MSKGQYHAPHIKRETVREYIKLLKARYKKFDPERASIYAGKSCNYLRAMTRYITSGKYNRDITLSRFLLAQDVCAKYIIEVLKDTYDYRVFTEDDLSC